MTKALAVKISKIRKSFSALFLLVSMLVVTGVATAAPTVVIDAPLANAALTVDNVLVSGIASASGGGQGIDLMMVVDNSGSLSTTDPTKARFTAIQQLMNSFSSTANVRVGMVFFDSTASVAVQLSTVSSATTSINQQIASKQPNGNTAIGTGITTAMAEFTARGRTNTSKIMVVFTDGDNNTGGSPTTAATAASAAGVKVNVVALGTSTTVNPANTAIATAGGGTVLTASSPAQLAALFASSQLVGLSSVTVTNTTHPATIPPSVTVSAGAYSAPIDLVSGANTITVVATDTAGVATTQTVSVTYTPPVTPTPVPVTPVRSVKLRPQVLMAGFDPMLVDITDSGFSVLAVVRPGTTNNIQNVTLATNVAGFSTAMNERGKLANDDRVYGLTLTFARGSLPTGQLANLFGSLQGQYNITAIDDAQQTHSFPSLTFGNNQNVTASASMPAATNYTATGLRRGRPQVIMGGFDPILLDYNDTSFKVKAIARAGSTPIQSVTLKNGTGFAQAMLAETPALANGDTMYYLTYVYPRGAFPATALSDLWGNSTSNQFIIEVTDAAQQTHQFPELRIGNYPTLP